MICNYGIYKGDDTNAFGQIFLTINGHIPEGFVVSKAVVKIGTLPLFIYENPVFPLIIQLEEELTSKLDRRNNVYMKVYDANGKGRTCNGTIVIEAKDEVIK